MRGVAIGWCLVLCLACARAEEGLTPALKQKVSYLEFRDGDLSEVLVGLGKFFRVNEVWTPDARGKRVTCVFSQMTLEEVLTALTAQAGLTWQAQGNLIWVGAKETPLEERGRGRR